MLQLVPTVSFGRLTHFLHSLGIDQSLVVSSNGHFNVGLGQLQDSQPPTYYIIFVLLFLLLYFSMQRLIAGWRLMKSDVASKVNAYRAMIMFAVTLC